MSNNGNNEFGGGSDAFVRRKRVQTVSLFISPIVFKQNPGEITINSEMYSPRRSIRRLSSPTLL